MVLATNLGFPRLGAQRELKWAIEKYWSGKSSQAEVEKAASGVRERHWRLQRDLGLDHIPSNDFSLYDHVLDTSVMLGAVPSQVCRFISPWRAACKTVLSVWISRPWR
jgi:5-methyltetrahydropteroyltriglutamate--homocysteine methyltransferase